MAYDKEGNGFISVPAPEFGAIFMANIATKRDCFKHKVFGLPSSMANFVKEVKKGMVLFLFEYERRQLFGVYRAISDGEMNIVPNAFSSSGKQFSAQVRFMPIWYCSPLSENEFHDAIRENYFSARKFHFGLSDEQVHRLLRLFSSRKLKNNLPLRKLTTGMSNLVDEDHVMVSRNNFVTRGGFGIKHSNVDLEPSRLRGSPRSSRGVKRVNDDKSLIEHRVEDEDKVDSAEHVHYHDKKRRNGYYERLLRDSAAKNDIHIHSLTEELGYCGDDWPSFSDRVKGGHKTQMNYTPAISNYMDNSCEPALSRKNRTDAFWKIGTVIDDRQSSLNDIIGKISHLDPDINSTIASERFVNPPYNLKGMYKDGRLFTREISGNESKFPTDRGFDHQAATDDVCFLSRRKGANEKCVDRFIIPAASNGNAAYAGEVCRQVVEIGNYPTNDFNGLVPGTENFQRPFALGECTAYSPMKKRTSGYSTEFLVETKSPHSTEAQNLGPSRSEFHDATITRVMPYKHEFSSSCYGHNSTYEVEEGSKSMQKPSSYDLHRGNNFTSAKGISSPYSYPEFTKRGLESNSEDGKRVLLRSQDGFRSPLNVGTSEAMERNRSGSFVYATAFIPRPSITQQLTRDDLNEGESWRFSSKAALDSIASHSFSGDYQRADEAPVDEHVTWQESDRTHIGRRSYSPNTNWLLHQGNFLTNLDHANSPGADIINDEYEGNILTDVVPSDSRNSKGSVFSRLSLAPKVPLLREQEADHSMSYDKYYMDTTVDEIMDLLYEDQNIVPKRPLNRKPFDQKVGYCETNKSLKHAVVVKNNAEQPAADSMMRVLRKSSNENLEEAVNHVLAETRVVDFKRRKEANRASEDTNAKLNKEEKSNANEHTVLQNAQENSSETAAAKDSADKPSKRRKLVRPVFDENHSMSDLNHQLPCQELGKVSTENSDLS